MSVERMFGRFCTNAYTLVTSPPLGASVLEPGFDLCVGHLQCFGQRSTFSRRQVLLPVKAFLQLTDLQAGEGRPGLFLLRRCPVLIRVTYTTCYSEG